MYDWPKRRSLQLLNRRGLNFPIPSKSESAAGVTQLYPFLLQVVAGLVGTAVGNVDVFSVQLKQERPPIIDVRYSAHGSPYYKAVMLDGILLSNRQKVRGVLVCGGRWGGGAVARSASPRGDGWSLKW